MQFIIRLLITAAIAYGLSMFLSGIHITDYVHALLFALVLAFLNAIVRPLMILLTLPITLLTLGLFLFVINALMIMLADKLVGGIRVDGFLWALLFSLLLSVLSATANSLLKNDKEPS